ncbi:hypothetical protein [Streptomyces sp. NPDC047061]|uniref:hypothetical protein n=1 Tax=Streptomyces sp. NPDC047061 TaxID=3154605 RepID=UPI0033F84E85
MRFGILGPLDVRADDGTPLDPGGPRPRRRGRTPVRSRDRDRDRMYRVLASRPPARFFKRMTEKAVTDIRLREYPALSAG